MSVFAVAVGLALVLEGLLPMLLPRVWRQTVERMSALSDNQIRWVGVGAALTGCLVMLAMN